MSAGLHDTVVDQDREESRDAARYAEPDNDRPTLAECRRDEADRPPPDRRPSCTAVRWTPAGEGTTCRLREHGQDVQHQPQLGDPWQPLLRPPHPDYREPEPAPW